MTRKTGINPAWHGIACAAGDYDNDGHTDLALSTAEQVFILHNEGNGTLKDVTEAVGIHIRNHPLSVTFVDYDHDGDLDLYVSSSDAGKSILWRNNGNSTFTDVTAETGLVTNAISYGIAATDFNNDRAIDLVFASAPRPQLFLNPREGKWSATDVWPQAALSPVVAAVTLAAGGRSRRVRFQQRRLDGPRAGPRWPPRHNLVAQPKGEKRRAGCASARGLAARLGDRGS